MIYVIGALLIAALGYAGYRADRIRHRSRG